MSIQTQITRISNAKSAISTAITGKGVNVPTNTKLDGMAALIDEINNPEVQVADDLTVLVIFIDGGSSSRPIEVEVTLYNYLSYVDENYSHNGVGLDSAMNVIRLPADGRWKYTWSNMFIPKGGPVTLGIYPKPAIVTGLVEGILLNTENNVGDFLVCPTENGQVIITYTADCYT